MGINAEYMGSLARSLASSPTELTSHRS